MGAKEAELEHRKIMQEASQLRRTRESVGREILLNRHGMLRKPSHENSHLKHLMIALTKGIKKLAKQRTRVARQLAEEARFAAQQSVASIERERKWRRQLTQVA